MELNERIRRRRQELKLSQEYVADQLGVSRQAVSKWETGQSDPTAKNLVELAALFEMSLSELVEPKNTEERQPQEDQSVLHTNLSLLAISMQAGVLYSCTQISYTLVDGQRIPDYRFSLFKLGLLFLCSVWMSRNLMYEQDPQQRKKNSQMELAYCMVQAAIGLCTYHFRLGIVGLALISAVLLFYNLYINPKYMNRPFGKKRTKKQHT